MKSINVSAGQNLNSKSTNFTVRSVHCFGLMWLILALASLTGCSSSPPINPSFPTAIDRADQILDDIAVHPKPLRRPVVVVSGFMDPGISALLIHQDIQKYVNDTRIMNVPLGFCISFDQCRQKIIEAVDAQYPSTDPVFTTEVDVIGFSMGGVAARYAAIEPWAGHSTPRRLKIARLFTISSPLRGAQAAGDVPIDLHPLQTDLEPGSVFIRRLNVDAAKENAYALYPYIRLGDNTIGFKNAAPPGQTAWWVVPPAMSAAHDSAYSDRRIIADIVLRLRDEKPLTSAPAAPPPAGYDDDDN